MEKRGNRVRIYHNNLPYHTVDIDDNAQLRIGLVYTKMLQITRLWGLLVQEILLKFVDYLIPHCRANIFLVTWEQNYEIRMLLITNSFIISVCTV